MKESAKRGAGIFLAVLGIVAFLGGVLTCVLQYTELRAQQNICVEVEARVVEVESWQRRETDSDGDHYYITYYRAIFEYEYAGRTYRKKDDTSTSSAFGSQYSVGDTVTVWVERQNPSAAHLPNSRMQGYTMGGFLAVFGYVLFSLSTFAFRIDKNEDSLLLRVFGIYLPVAAILAAVLWFVGSHFGNGGRVNLWTNLPFMSALAVAAVFAAVLLADFIARLSSRIGGRKARKKAEVSADTTAGGEKRP